ncbi:MAG: O-antigen ligase family protein [Bacteroidales bacterium]|nr:O-antigen ligase family protein [Bacteroidales bacterium]
MTGQKSKYYDFVKNASLFFALVIAFWIPSYRWVLSDFIVAWLLFSVSELNFKQRIKINLNSRFIIIIFILQLTLFFLVSGEYFFAGNKEIIAKNITQKLSLLIFPLLFALSGTNFKNKKYLFLKLFVLSNVLMSLICLGTAFYNSFHFSEGVFVFNSYDINKFSYFTNSNLSVFHHRSYFSMFIVFSSAILFYLKEKSDLFKSKKRNIIFWFVLLFFILMIYLLESRAGIISLIILLSWQLVHKIFFNGKIIYKIVTLGLIVLMIFIAVQNKRVKRTINQIIETEQKEKTIISGEAPARIGLWTSAVNIIKENYLTGIGKENFQVNFNKEYQKYTKLTPEKVNLQSLNVHNQFLEEFVLYGIFGFLLLLALFVYPIIISFKRKNYLFFAFLLITGFNFLFESMLNTIAGIVFFLYFLNYFIFVFDDTNSKLKTTE